MPTNLPPALTPAQKAGRAIADLLALDLSDDAAVAAFLSTHSGTHLAKGRQQIARLGEAKRLAMVLYTGVSRDQDWAWIPVTRAARVVAAPNATAGLRRASAMAELRAFVDQFTGERFTDEDLEVFCGTLGMYDLALCDLDREAVEYVCHRMTNANKVFSLAYGMGVLSVRVGAFGDAPTGRSIVEAQRNASNAFRNAWATHHGGIETAAAAAAARRKSRAQAAARKKARAKAGAKVETETKAATKKGGTRAHAGRSAAPKRRR